MAALDAIVVGSGPNGLAAAIRLARAGLRVHVLEAMERPGGAMRSAELTLPGFVHDMGSAIHPMAAGSPYFRALDLERYGLEWVQPEIALAHPVAEGIPAAAMYRSLEETAAGLGSDGAGYARMMGRLVERWEALMEEIMQPLLHVPWHPILMAEFGVRALLPARTLMQRVFKEKRGRALFAGLAGHSFQPFHAPGSSAVALALGAAGHAVGWPFPRGGAQRLVDALVKCLSAAGGTIECGARVRSLADVPPAKAVLLDVTAGRFLEIAGDRLPAAYRGALERFPHGPGIFKIDYALDGPVPWADEACRRAGTVDVGGSAAEIAECEAAVARGRVPDRPFVLVAQHSIFDASRAPAGKHTLWAYCHIPYGSIFDMTGRIEAQIERFAPGFREQVLARHVMGPVELERWNPNLAGGDISGGSNALWRLIARPVLDAEPYRTPLAGVYLCSSSTPPGGGVHGMCGYNAAGVAMGELGRKL